MKEYEYNIKINKRNITINDKLIKEIEADVKNAMNIIRTKYMPSGSELRKYNMRWLETKIEKYGGRTIWADILGLEIKPNNIPINYDDQYIINVFNEIIDELELSRLPSHFELRERGYGHIITFLKRTRGNISNWAKDDKIFPYLKLREKNIVKNKKEKIKENNALNNKKVNSKQTKNNELKQKSISTSKSTWTHEKILEQILDVMQELCINRLPTKKEMNKVTGSWSLYSAMRKFGGVEYWANILNVKAGSEAKNFGMKFENIAGDILENKKFKIDRMRDGYPFDILVNDKVKIDVKTSKQHKLKNDEIEYIFFVNEKYPTSDFYMMLGVNENREKIKVIYIIPSYMVKGTVRIRYGKKFNKYINRFDLIEKLDKFYKGE